MSAEEGERIESAQSAKGDKHAALLRSEVI